MLDLDRLCINSFFLVLINIGSASVQVWLKMWTLCADCMIRYSSPFYQKKDIQAQQVAGKCWFSLFKAGIEPKWDDPECAAGGKWSITNNRNASLNTMWLEIAKISLFLKIFLFFIFRMTKISLEQNILIKWGWH